MSGHGARRCFTRFANQSNAIFGIGVLRLSCHVNAPLRVPALLHEREQREGIVTLGRNFHVADQRALNRDPYVCRFARLGNDGEAQVRISVEHGERTHLATLHVWIDGRVVGGGTSVLAVDHFAEQGFEVPLLDREGIAAMRRLQLPAGSLDSNPIDVPANAMRHGEGRLARFSMSCTGTLTRKL